jgi:uncharacterized RDD family membrane protein YckC
VFPVGAGRLWSRTHPLLDYRGLVDPEDAVVPPQPEPSTRLTRADVAGWLSGPGSVRPSTRPDGSDWEYPGQRLELPQAGPRSVARLGRRLAALAIDWGACLLLVRMFFPGLDYGSPASSFATLGIFGLEVALFSWLSGSSFGQRLLGMQLVRLSGRPPGLWRAVLRTFLLCLAVPPLIWDRDQRGLHDRLAGTVLLRTG